MYTQTLTLSHIVKSFEGSVTANHGGGLKGKIPHLWYGGGVGVGDFQLGR